MIATRHKNKIKWKEKEKDKERKKGRKKEKNTKHSHQLKSKKIPKFPIFTQRTSYKKII
jgi:hypothetical protein